VEALKRTAAYKLLSMAISYPEGIVAEAFSTGWLFSQMKEVFSPYGHLLLAIERAERDFEGVEELQVTYTSSFDLRIPLYESYYVVKSDKPEDKVNFLFELEKLYMSCGVELVDRDMPDFIGTELEFMHYLCSEGSLRKQRDFLKAHLVSWVPLLAEKVQQENVTFYRHLIAAIDKFVAMDYGSL